MPISYVYMHVQYSGHESLCQYTVYLNMKLISYLVDGFSHLFSLDLMIRQTNAVPDEANKIKRATMMDPRTPPITFAELEVLDATCIVVFATDTVTVVLVTMAFVIAVFVTVVVAFVTA